MPTIDLTRRADEAELEYKAVLSEVPLESESTRYTGVIYSLTTSSMHGTYIDFPGHIKETDNGLYAHNFPHEELYRVPASVIHLDRDRGPVSGAELEHAFGGADSCSGDQRAGSAR